MKWINFGKLLVYYVDEGVPDTYEDVEFEAIDNAVIDGASDKINMDYENMVD